MRARSRRSSVVLAFSDRLYRALLRLYPNAFRRTFSSDMAQVFRDECRQAHAERGVFGVLEPWAVAIADLPITALQEHLAPEGRMSRASFVRASGAVARLGGGLNLLSFLILLPLGLARAAAPLSVVCMFVGIVGLHVLLWRRAGWLGWLGFLLAGVGLTLGLIGMAGPALGIVDPNPLAPIITTGEHAGLVIIGAGLLLWGIITLRLNALGRWSILPLAMSLLGLTGIAFLNPEAFEAVEHSVLPDLFGATWILLGYALLTSRATAALSATRSVAG